MEQVSLNEFILIYWKWKWLAWWIYRMDGLLQPPVSTKPSASFIIITLVPMAGSLGLVDRWFFFWGFLSALDSGRRAELVTAARQSVKCWRISLDKQEERICSFVIFMSAGTGWRWGSSYRSLTHRQNWLCKYLWPRLSSSSCIEIFCPCVAYLEMSNGSWNHISLVTV